MGPIDIWKIISLANRSKNKESYKDEKFWKDLFLIILKEKGVRKMLQGYKTYIVAIALGAATTAKALGYIDDSIYNIIVGFLGSAGAATLAAKINRTNK